MSSKSEVIAAALRNLFDPALSHAEFAARLFEMGSLSSGLMTYPDQLQAVVSRIARALIDVYRPGGYVVSGEDRQWLEYLIVQGFGPQFREPLRDELTRGLAGQVGGGDLREPFRILIRCGGAADVAQVLADDPRGVVRHDAADTLRYTHGDALPSAVAALGTALDDPDPDVRMVAFESYVIVLTEHGEHNPDARGHNMILGGEIAEDFVRRLAEDPALRTLEDSVPGGLTDWPTGLAVPTANLCRPDRRASVTVRVFAAASLAKADPRRISQWKDPVRDVVEVLEETAAADPDETVRVAASASVAALRTKELIRTCRPDEWALGVAVDTSWRTSDVLGLLQPSYQEINSGQGSGLLPILADALEEAGCPHDSPLLAHARSEQHHSWGCWVLECLLSDYGSRTENGP